MRRLVYALPLLALMACEDEKHVSHAPVFSGFRAVSAFADQIDLAHDLQAGDSIIVTAVQESKGEYIYEAQYRWSVDYTNGETGQSRTLGTKSSTVVYDADPSDPVVRFRLPDTIGTVRVNFTAEYQYSSATVTQIDGSKGGITVSGSTLMGRATGNRSYNVNRTSGSE